jgi:hypothetical protein
VEDESKTIQIKSSFCSSANARRSIVLTVSPFLLFDYAGPHMFEPSTAQRGVD